MIDEVSCEVLITDKYVLFLLTDVFYVYYICNLDYLDYCLYPVKDFFDK
jgi:hypothetical protein